MSSTDYLPKAVDRRVRHRLARVVTELSGPAICAVAGLLVVAIRNAGNGAGAAWGGFAAIFVAGVPMGYIARGVRAGKWADHHVGEREQRALPLLVAAASVAFAVILLVVVHAPPDLAALVAAMLAGLLIVLAVTHWWKVSIHTAVAAGLLGVFLVIFGLWALLGLTVLVAVAWSRTVMDAHSWPQVTVGALLGFLVAVTIFPLLR